MKTYLGNHVYLSDESMAGLCIYVDRGAGRKHVIFIQEEVLKNLYETIKGIYEDKVDYSGEPAICDKL